MSYLTLLREDAPQRVHGLRDVFDAVRWMVEAGCPWRMLPGDFPPWQAVEQQAKKWMAAGCFETMVHDLREMLRLLQERNPRPTAAILDGRTLPSSPESGGRAGYDGYKRKKGGRRRKRIIKHVKAHGEGEAAGIFPVRRSEFASTCSRPSG